MLGPRDTVPLDFKARGGRFAAEEDSYPDAVKLTGSFRPHDE